MNKRGVALILGFMVIVVLTTLGAAIISRSVSERTSTQRYTRSTHAFWLAEAGVQRALWELNYAGGAWTGWGGSGNTRTFQGYLTGSGDYDITVNFNALIITAIGFFPSRTATDRMERTIIVNIKGGSPFTYVAFGMNSVAIAKESNIDSYDSSVGNYGGSNIGANGDAGTNGTTSGVITIDKDTTVHGDASTGPSGTVDLGEGAQITGTTTHSNNVNLSSVVVPATLTGLDSSGSITGSQTLASGNYKFDSIIIEENGTLTINGPANIYVTSTSDAIKIKKDADIVINNGQVNFYVNGNVEIKKEGTINNQNPPQNFILYGTSNSTTISIAKENNFYGAIYAPNADISISKEGAFYGSMIGKTVNIKKETSVHYDEALRRLTGLSGYTVQSWQDTQNPYRITP